MQPSAMTDTASLCALGEWRPWYLFQGADSASISFYAGGHFYPEDSEEKEWMDDLEDQIVEWKPAEWKSGKRPKTKH